MQNSRRAAAGLFALTLFLLVPAVVFSSAPNGIEDPEVAQETVTLTGCISQDGDSWKLTDADGNDVWLAASEQIAALDGHSAELSGSWAEVDGRRLFAATGVKDLGAC